MTTHAPEIAAEYLVLHGRSTSVVLEHRADEAPLWRYWGPRLPDGCLPLAPLRDGRPVPPSSLEFDQPFTIAPSFGVGWFGQTALLAHRVAVVPDGAGVGSGFGCGNCAHTSSLASAPTSLLP